MNPADVADRLCEWYASDPVDVGGITAQTLENLRHGMTGEEAGRDTYRARPEGANATNGCAVRAAPLAVAYADHPARLDESSRAVSRTTHTDRWCTHGTAVLNRTVAGLLRQDPHPLAAAVSAVRTTAPDALVDALAPIVRGETPPLSTSGYIVDTLQTALHDGLSEPSAETAITTAINRGGDADTIGAVTGAIAGARFGTDALPPRWRTVVDETAELRTLADQLAGLTPLT